MSIKDWISLYAAGTGLDHDAAGSMEELVNGADVTRVAQWHALRDALIAVQKETYGAPWFEWNGTDLTQFDSKIDRERVSSSTVQVESICGTNWVTISTTSLAGGSPNGYNTATVLPITTTPPSADYVVVADYLNLTATGTTNVQAGVALRYGSQVGYFTRVSTRALQSQGRFAWSGSVSSVVTIGPDLSDPTFSGVDQGSRLVGEVRGGDGGSDVLLSMQGCGGEWLRCRETTNLITAAGQAAIWTGTSAASATIKNAFRRIRCYTVLD